MRFFVLSGGMFYNKHYCTSVPNPDNVGLHSKMVDTDREQNLDSLESREDFAQLRQDVQQQISSISANVKRLEDQLDKLQYKIAGQNSKRTDDDARENMVELVAKEIEERELRKRCLLIFNLPEDPDLDLQGQKFEDRYQLKKLLNEEMKLDVKILDTERFRSRKVATSIVRVEFSSQEDRRKVASSLANLHMSNGTKPRITFRQSLTKMQQKALEREVSKRNSESQSLGMGRPWYIASSGEIRHRKPKPTEALKEPSQEFQA